VNIAELKKISSSVGHIGYPSVVVNRLRKIYCPKIQGMGKCEKPCSQNEFCRVHIRNIISDVREGADNPVAVFVWCIQEEIASIEEECEISQVGISSSFGETKYRSFQEALTILQHEIAT